MVASIGNLSVVDAEAMEAEDSLSAEQLEELNCLALPNLFIKEDGSSMDFYLRKSRFQGRPDKVELSAKFEKLITEAQKYGASLTCEPSSPYSIEIAFPEVFTSEEEVDSDVFDAAYISKCIDEEGLLDLEEFRIGKSPYDGTVNITDILRGIKSWDDAKRPDAPQGRKLPNFAPIEKITRLRKDPSPKKKKRAEYSVKEDTEILKYVLEKELHRKVGGNRVWQIVSKAFPHHSYQSLQNRFRRTILPNLDSYTGLTESEKELFRRPASSDDEPNTSQAATSVTKKTHSSTSCDDSDVTLRESRKRKSEELEEDEAEKCEQVSPVKPVRSKGEHDSEAETVLATPKSTDDSRRHSTNTELSEESDKETVEMIREGECSEPGPSTSSKPFRVQEDRLILEYIVKKDLFQGVTIPGNKAVWLEVRDKVLKGYNRSAEAIENRFRTHIATHLECKAYRLSEDVVRKLRPVPESPGDEPQLVDDSMEEDKPVGEGSSAAKEGKGKRLRARGTGPAEKSKEDSEADSIQISSQSTSDESDSDRKKPKKAKMKKVRRRISGAGGRLYSSEEDKKIIDYIVKTGRFAEVRGKLLWVDIESKVLHKHHRTWESAKNRFLKTIVKELTNRRYGLDAATIQKFRHGLTVERHMGGARREKSKKPAEEQQKHPALAPKSSKSPVTPQKRKALYKQPGLPAPVLFTPASASATRKAVKKPAGVNLKRDLEKGQEPDEVLDATPPAPSRLKPLPIVVRKEQPRVLDHLEDEVVIAGTSASTSVGIIREQSTGRPWRNVGRHRSDQDGSVAESQDEGKISCDEPIIPAVMIPQLTRQLRVVLHRLTPEQLAKYGCQSPETKEKAVVEKAETDSSTSSFSLRSPAKTPCPTTPRQQLDPRRSPSSGTGSPMLWFTADIFHDFGHAPTPRSASKSKTTSLSQPPSTATSSPPSPSRASHTPSPSMARRSLLDLKALKGHVTPTEEVNVPGVTVIEESDDDLDRASQIAVTGSFDTEESSMSTQEGKIDRPVAKSTQLEDNSCESEIYFTPSEENNGK